MTYEASPAAPVLMPLNSIQATLPIITGILTLPERVRITIVAAGRTLQIRRQSGLPDGSGKRSERFAGLRRRHVPSDTETENRGREHGKLPERRIFGRSTEIRKSPYRHASLSAG
jgi:hypothetical protein